MISSFHVPVSILNDSWIPTGAALQPSTGPSQSGKFNVGPQIGDVPYHDSMATSQHGGGKCQPQYRGSMEVRRLILALSTETRVIWMRNFGSLVPETMAADSVLSAIIEPDLGDGLDAVKKMSTWLADA